MKYTIIDAETKEIKNIIMYDGEGDYNPGLGMKLVGPLADGEMAAIGWFHDEDTDTFSPPPVIEDPLATE